ncbi:MAG: hypothetical protein ACRCTR_04305 [Actinomycetota bacterium]
MWWWILLVFLLLLLAVIVHGLLWWRTIRRGLALARELGSSAEELTALWQPAADAYQPASSSLANPHLVSSGPVRTAWRKQHSGRKSVR